MVGQVGGRGAGRANESQAAFASHFLSWQELKLVERRLKKIKKDKKQRRMSVVRKMSETTVGIIRDSYRESNLSAGAGARFTAADTQGSTRLFN